MKKLIMALPLLLTVAGCEGRSGSEATSLDMRAEAALSTNSIRFGPARASARPRVVASDVALIRLPEGAGAVKRVSERRHPNGYSQEIELVSDAASTESVVEIAVQNGKPLASSTKAPVWKPGEAGIRDELNRRFSGMRMQVVGNGGYENKYGRFGVAIGRKGESLRCVYAWQYVEDARKSFEDGNRIAVEGAAEAPAALRIKLCRSDVTVDELVDFVRRLTIAVPENLAAPQDLAEDAPLRPAAPKARTKSPRRSHSVLAADGRTPDVVAPPIFSAADFPPDAQGMRYMAPVAAPPPGIGQNGQVGVEPSLPPQAYRGPVALQTPNTPAPNSNFHSAAPTADQPPKSAAASIAGAPRIAPLTVEADRLN